MSFRTKSFFLKYCAAMSSKCKTIGRIGDVKSASRIAEIVAFPFLFLMKPDNIVGIIIAISEHQMT